MSYLADGGSLQERDDVPDWAKSVFVTSADISPEMHVRMQSAFQESVDAAISKTINFPNRATEEDVRQAYMLSWELECKGITVYRAGSREAEVLTKGVGKEKAATAAPANEPTGQGTLVPRERPPVVSGVTERVRTAHGNMYVTINYDENGRPFEVFSALGKAGSSDSAQLEAISRLVSMALRAGVDPNEVVEHLRGITDEPVWDAGRLVRSAPDAVSLVLSRHLQRGGTPPPEELTTADDKSTAQLGLFARAHEEVDRSGSNGHPAGSGATCPDCSVGTLVHQEGCIRCPECGYNKCE